MLYNQVIDPAKTRITFATCPGCKQRIRLTGKLFRSRQATCPNCHAQVTVVQTDPVQCCCALEEWDVDEDDWES